VKREPKNELECQYEEDNDQLPEEGPDLRAGRHIN
jgi:hypothetical protein